MAVRLASSVGGGRSMLWGMGAAAGMGRIWGGGGGGEPVLPAGGVVRTASLRRGVGEGQRSYQAPAKSWDECQGIMRTRDMDNMLCFAFLPPGVNSASLAVRAFNAEIASAADKVRDPRDPRMAQLRLSWWLEALDRLEEGDAPAHPVAEALAATLFAYPAMDTQLLRSMVEWRIKDLEGTQPATIDSLELYAEGTQTAMYNLILQAMGEFEAEQNVKAASHVGQATGLLLLLKGTRAHARRNRVYIPKNIATANKLSLGELVKCHPSQELSQCVYEVAMEAKRHLELAHELKPTKGAVKALMPAAISTLYLEQLEKYEYDVMNPAFHLAPERGRLWLQWRLLKNSLWGTF